MSRQASAGDATDPQSLEREALENAQELLGHVFSTPSLILQALTHRSWAHQHGRVAHNERLELLGDAVIGLVVTEEIFRRFGTMAEGDLTQLKSFLVSRRLEAKVCRKLGLERCLLVGSAERKSGVGSRTSTLANLFEAVVAALYLDAGLNKTADFLRETLLSEVPTRSHLKDPKTQLQELVQGRQLPHPHYRVLAVEGPDHHPLFTVEVLVGDRALARGVGPSKKEAEKNAARAALSVLADEMAAGVQPGAGHARVAQGESAGTLHPGRASDRLDPEEGPREPPPPPEVG